MNEIRPPKSAGAPVREANLASGDTPLIVWDGLLGFVQRRRRTIIATTLVVSILGLAFILFAPWSYKATVVVAINANPAIPENPHVSQPMPQAERMQREIQGLQSRALAARVIENLKLDQEPEFNPELQGTGLLERMTASIASLGHLFRKSSAPTPAEVEDLRRSAIVDMFMDRLAVTPVLTADLIQVTFASRDPRVAYRVANGVADAYIRTAMGTRGDALQKAADALQERISAVKDELRDLPVGAGGVNTIERQLEAKRTLLQAYIAKLGELLLLKAAIEPRIFIQSRAVYPLRRAGIPLALGLPVVVIAGLMAGVALSIVQEGRQKKITSASQLEGLFGLAVLGTPPKWDRPRWSGFGARPDRALNADPKRLEKACDRIAMELMIAREGGRSTIVAFTSPSHSEAKSAICVGVARALARGNHRTLMVDSSLGPSSAQARLSAQAKPTPAASQDVSVPASTGTAFEMRRDPSVAMDILMTGLDRDSGAAVYEHVAKAVTALAPQYEFVFLDLAPVGGHPEARYLARYAELAVLVVRRDHDHRDALQAGIERLETTGVRIVGAVLTRGKFERNALSRAADRLRLKA